LKKKKPQVPKKPEPNLEEKKTKRKNNPLPLRETKKQPQTPQTPPRPYREQKKEKKTVDSSRLALELATILSNGLLNWTFKTGHRRQSQKLQNADACHS
jgi:hypothetical protein